MPNSGRHRSSDDRDAANGSFAVAADAPDAENLTNTSLRGANGPASSLIRWEHHEDLRESVTEYAKRERYSVHAVLIESIRRGLAQIETSGWTPNEQGPSGVRPTGPNHGHDERKSIVVELKARAYRDEDGTWTVEIPELTSRTPSGATLVATGSARTSQELARAAVDLASAWLGVEPTEVAVDVSVDEPGRS